MPRSARLRAPLLGLVLVCAGCGGVTVRSELPSGSPTRYDVPRYLWGLIGGELEVGARPIARVELDETVEDRLLTWLSGGFYCPVTAKVWFVEDRGEP